MIRFVVLAAIGGLAVLLAACPLLGPAQAGGYRMSYGHSYPSYGYGHSYSYSYPVYVPAYYPTYYSYPSYSYSYAAPSYSYATPSYSAPTSGLYDGQYHYHAAGSTRDGTYYPAGMYRWYQGQWQAQNGVPKDWKSQLLTLATARDKVEAQIRLNAAEAAQFNQALKAMGLEGNFHFDQYGQHPAPFVQPKPQAGYGNHNYNLGSYGSNGSTIYGYTLNTIKDLYGDSSMNTLFQQAERLASNSQTLAGQATQQFQASITQEGSNRARVAEALARGQAAAQALKAADSPGSRETTSSTAFRIEQGSGDRSQESGVRSQGAQPRVESQEGEGTALQQAFVQLATSKCLRCHGEDKQEGKFDVRKYPQMSLEEKARRVWPRLTHPDEAKKMPKEGKPLSAEELRIFYNN